MKSKIIYQLATVLGSALVLSSCGGGGGGSSLSLTKLPSAAEMIKTSSTSGAMTYNESLRGLPAVVGTPPKLVDFSSTNIDGYFWNGELAAIATHATGHSGRASSSQAQDFWGDHDGSAGGAGACQMAQSVGYSFEPILQSATTFCYMKSIPTLASSTLAPEGTDAASVFNQQAEDRLVRVNIQGTPPGGGGGGDGHMSVFIKVLGANTVGSDSYRIQMYQCKNGTVSSTEDDAVDLTTHEFSSTSLGNDDWGTNSTVIHAFLSENADGTFTFDASKDRTAVTHNGQAGTSNFYKANITVNSANQILAKTRGNWGGSESKQYSAASFSGNGIQNLSFLAAGFKNRWINPGDASISDHTAAVEYNTDHYVAASTGTLYDLANAVDFDSDSFYAGTLTAPSVSISGDCDAAGDITVAMNFDAADAIAVAQSCEEHELTHMDFCYGSTVQTAQTSIWDCNNWMGAGHGNCE